MRPSVLLVTHFYPSHRGGVEIVAGQLAQRLAGDLRIRWAAGRDGGSYDPPPNVTLIPLGVWNAIERRTGIPIPVPGPRAIVRLLREVRRADVVWVHDLLYPLNLFAAVAARLSKRPLVVTVHVGPIPYQNRFLRLIMGLSYRWTARLLLPRAAKVAFVSERVRDETVRPDWRRTAAFIPNGFDPGVFQLPSTTEHARVRHEMDATGRPLLLFVGRFVERKGLALIRIIAAENPGWRWVLAGRGPIDPTSWRLPNVTVVGGVSGTTLARLYGAADLLVLPSVGEGFPLVVIEAMACGTPAIVDPSTANGDRTAAVWLETESVTDPNAIQRWQQHIEQVLSLGADPDRRRELSDFAAAHWSWDRAADAYRATLISAFRR